MSTVIIPCHPLNAIPFGDSGAPRGIGVGTNFRIPHCAFDAAVDETVFFNFRAVRYGTGNLTLDIDWYADTASSGVVRWGAAIMAYTPNTDSTDFIQEAFATATEVNDTHLGTTNQRLHRATMTITNLDSLAEDDYVALKIYREGTDGGDTMTGDALMTMAIISYSDV